ncbi:hypothetical protein RHSIM_Rhsim05G0059300 [Rhododendron simsii]|uniref:Agglutinin domain-containing protein n=1 Tax=Rhododendron simsii TaxID=118357 RepID=A0A834GY30_RHOSS|nr:hypothetical protein RHSIM_Rhsim05G0059300 [Rhododendron simsii]
MALPKFVVIKLASNKTYLQLPYEKNTLLKFKELGSDSKGYKHEVEEAKSEAGLVHIKCCETGKYWTLAGMHNNINIIAAEADKPVEDGTSAACTLIKPTLKYIGGITVVNFQFQRQSKWQSVFVNSMGCLESGENMAEDFIVSDWEKLQRPHPNKSTGTPTGGDVMVEGIEIEDGVFIGGVEARGPGHLSVFGTSFGGGSSAGGGVSVADANFKPGGVPVGGSFTFGKRTIKGGLRIGCAPT